MRRIHLLSALLVAVARIDDRALVAQPAADTSVLDIAEQPSHTCCRAVAVDPEGRLLATADGDAVTIWDLETGLELRTLVARARPIASRPREPIETNGYSGLGFDPSGRYLASTAVDNSNPRTADRARTLAVPYVWEVSTGRDLSAVDWTYDAVTQRTVSSAFPFNPAETLFWQVVGDQSAASRLASYRGRATTFDPSGRLGVSFIPEGGLGYPYRLTVIDLASDRELWTMRTPTGVGEPPAVVFSPDGRWVVIATAESHSVFEARSGSHVVDLDGRAWAFSRDSTRLVGISKNQVRVFTVADWTSLLDIRVSGDQALYRVFIAPPGDRIIAASDHAIHVWEAASGRLVRQIPFDAARPAQSLAMSPQQRWLAVGTGHRSRFNATGQPGEVILWPLDGATVPQQLWSEEDVSIRAVAFSQDGRRLAAISYGETGSRGGPIFDGDISICVLPECRARSRLLMRREEERQGDYDVIPEAAATELAFSRDGSTLAAAVLGLRAYRPAGQRYREFEPYSRLLLYDAKTSLLQQSVDMFNSPGFSALALSVDGAYVATGHDQNTLRVWRAATGRQQGLFRWPIADRRDVLGNALFGDSITGLAFHPDGRRLAVSRHDGVALLDVVRRTRREIVAERGFGYSAVSFSPDGSLVVSAGGRVHGTSFVDARITAWDTATLTPQWILDLATPEISRAVFEPSGKWLAVSTTNSVSVHDTKSGARIATLATLATGDWLAWTPDGQYAGSPAGIARLAGVRSGRVVLPLSAVGRQVSLEVLLAQALP